MEVGEARAVLGVRADAPWAEVRAAFRRLVRAMHPDTTGGGVDAGIRVGRVIRAYAVLDEQRRRPDPRPSPPAAPAAPPAGPRDDTLVVGARRHDLFFRLLEAGHALGEVTYVDPSAGLIEIVVEFEGWPTSSLLVTLRRRGRGVTEATCAIESLTNLPAPPVAPVAMLLRERLQRVPT